MNMSFISQNGVYHSNTLNTSLCISNWEALEHTHQSAPMLHYTCSYRYVNTLAGWKSAKKRPIKPIQGKCHSENGNILLPEVLHTNRDTLLIWFSDANFFFLIRLCSHGNVSWTWICIAVIHSSRWQHIQHNQNPYSAYSQHDLAFCSSRREWEFIMCDCWPLHRASTLVLLQAFSLPLPPPLLLVAFLKWN